MIKPTEGEIFGTWNGTWGYYLKLIGYRAGRKIFIESRFSDGSASTKEYVAKKMFGKSVLVYGDGTDFGEYYVINAEGDLEFWGVDGNFYTAKRMEKTFAYL